MPTVTIVTACLNGARYLDSCIESVLAQEVVDWEWLVIDDGSSDESVEIVGKLRRRDGRVRLLTTAGREGAAAARNLGISAASGRYIAFLDCDDVWLPAKLSLQLGTMRTGNLAFCWTSYFVVDESGKHLRTQVSPQHCTYRDLLTKRAVVGCLTAMYDQQQYGCQLMPAIRMGQDYGLFLRLLKIAETKGLGVAGIPLPLAKYRVHPAALTRNKIKKAWYQWKMYRDVEQLSLTNSLTCFASYFANAIRNRL